ncbi:MAG TPA: hypothetical protein VHC90_07315 [Bryobacteraceae bacterium]|nr:hypothetical protein [Bryobacteraceae bacterium]
MPFTVMVCCNDHRNGVSLGRFENLEIFECELSGPPMTFSCSNKRHPEANAGTGDMTARFGRLVVPCLLYRGWVGNWCWDAVRVRLIYAVRIWNHLVDTGKWQCEQGPAALYELFNAKGRIDPKTAPEFLGPILFPEANGRSGVAQ